MPVAHPPGLAGREVTNGVVANADSDHRNYLTIEIKVCSGIV
jgi:hypothetical protein